MCCVEWKKMYFCNPVLRVAQSARGKAAANRKGETGHSSLNEWNDVANNSSFFLESFKRLYDKAGTDETPEGAALRAKNLLRMESLILAQDERWRQA